MAIQFYDPVVSDISNVKHEHIKVVKLTFADFTTASPTSIKAVLPADASIISFEYWKKTAFSGGTVSAVTLSVGITGTATKFVNAVDVHTSAAGTSAIVTPVSNIMQPYDLPLGTNIALLFTGTATTGNPTAGELYVTIRYVR